MPDINLIINKGLRLHFCVSVGYHSRWLPGRLNNKEKLILHLIKDLRWRVRFFDETSSEDCFFKDSVELEADVDGELAESLESALKAVMRIKAISKRDLERFKSMPLADACKELTARLILEG